jgi:hypothetical protein
MKQKLVEITKKHALPDVTQWIVIDEETTLADIRAAFQDKLFGFADIVNTLLRPEDISAMVEAQVFAEHERERIEHFANHLMLLSKDCLIADIAATEQEELLLVKRLCTEWPYIVGEMKKLVSRTKQAYDGSKPGVHVVSYLG